MYSNNDWRSYRSDELRHHGILGMRWGKLNGPPYPLGASDHSASEKRNHYKLSIGMRKGSRNESKYAEVKKTLPSDIKEQKEKRENKKDLIDTDKLKKKQQALDPAALKKYIGEINKKSFEERKKQITKEERDSYRNEMIKRGNDADFYKNASDTEIDNDIEKKQRIKKAIIVGAAAVGIGSACYMAYRSGALDRIIANVNLHRNLSEDELRKAYAVAKGKSLDDIGLVLNKNTTLHRMVGYSDFDINKVNGPLYAAYKDTDVATYKAFLKDFLGTGKRYDVSLGIKKNLVAPSRQKTEQIVANLFKNDKDFEADLARTILRFNTNNHYTPAQLDQAIKQIHGASDKWKFDQVIWGIARNDDMAKKAMNAIQKEGFNTILDFHDIDAPLTQAPLIILNGNENLMQIGQKFVDERAKMNAVQFLRGNASKLTPEIRKTFGL